MNPAYELDKQAIKTHFEAAACRYDMHAVLQREVAQRMVDRLLLVKLTPQSILDAGCGTAFITNTLQARYPNAQVLQLDLAVAMLRCARKRQPLLRQWHNWFMGKQPRQIGGDMEQMPFASACVDLLWSNLVLQWCNPERAFSECYRVLKPGGLFMFSTIGPDTLKELRAIFAEIDAYPHVHRFIDMHDLGDALLRQQFSAPIVDMERFTLQYPDVKSMRQDLKGSGSSNASPGRCREWMGKQVWQKVLADYETLRDDGQLPCTYEVIYGHAWKEASEPPDTHKPRTMKRYPIRALSAAHMQMRDDYESRQASKFSKEL